MGRRFSIHGVVMARDEWPLLELSITHALLHHVDRVWVIDHASADGTAEGLRRLAAVWGDRLIVMRLEAAPFFQEAVVNTLLELVNPRADDWVYPFDADEFAIAPAATPLRDVLAEVGSQYAAVRYDIDNWVVPIDFDHTDRRQYAGLHCRALPSLFVDLGAELTGDEIRCGTMNFFDVPFPPKVVVRGGLGGWLAAGAHNLKPYRPEHELAIDRGRFRVAHFPLLSRDRLRLRVQQGRDLIAMNFPSWHGWQSQMLARLDREGLLDAFWSRHSIGADVAAESGCRPTVVRDDTFSQAVQRTLAWLDEHQRTGTPVVPRQDQPSEASAALLTAALRSIRKLQSTLEALVKRQPAADGDRAAQPADACVREIAGDAVVPARDTLGEPYERPDRKSSAVLEPSGTPTETGGRKVFGIGWAKTGTTTLGVCFEMLGLSHQGPDLSLVHDLRSGDLSRIIGVASRSQAFEDWPWPVLFREMDEAFPGSVFILTVRSPQRWLQSYRTMLASQGVATREMNEMRSILYGLPFPDVSDGQLLDRFNAHNTAVRRYFRSRPNDLLVVDWETGCGWREVCGFLGMEIPRRPFPWANRGVHQTHAGSAIGSGVEPMPGASG